MVTRPWVSSDELRLFSERQEIKDKTDEKLKVMISVAERKVIEYCHHDFTGKEYAGILPSDVKSAVLILADALCYNDSLRNSSTLKSETYDDYSYTIDAHEVSTDFDTLGVASLLEQYVDKDLGNLNFRIGVI